jgi:uncharacterized protein YukE
MTNIRVDPAELARAAEELKALSERVRAIGEEAHAAAASAPSYEGQFGPKAERLGLEALSAIDSQSQRLAQRAAELLEISQAFAEADQRSQSGFAGVWDLLNGWIEKAEEILPSWLIGWLHKESGYPWTQVGISKPEGEPPDSQRWPLPLLYLISGRPSTPPPGVITTPMPPEVPPGHTPTPPGWTPPPSPTPVPSGTPSPEQMEAHYQE